MMDQPQDQEPLGQIEGGDPAVVPATHQARALRALAVAQGLMGDSLPEVTKAADRDSLIFQAEAWAMVSLAESAIRIVEILEGQ